MWGSWPSLLVRNELRNLNYMRIILQVRCKIPLGWGALIRGLWRTCVRGQRKEIKDNSLWQRGRRLCGNTWQNPEAWGSSAERQGSENRTQEQLGILVLRAHPQDFKSVPCHGIRKREKDSKEVMWTETAEDQRAGLLCPFHPNGNTSLSMLWSLIFTKFPLFL